MALSDMANASNEKKEQNIIILRNMFRKQEVYTTIAAAKAMVLSENTIIKYCKQGSIPLIDPKTNRTVVPMTDTNTPEWLAQF